MEEKDSTTIRRAVINKAIGFIFDNMEEEIAVDDVAKHCGYSKYHLMRMFKEDTDEALYQFMKRVRLERSAWRLKVEKDKYAVYHYKGFPQFLFMVYQEVFCRWLSKTGNQLDNRPIFDIYRNIREDGYMEIDICFPLK